MILIRYSSHSNNEGNFHRLGLNLWSLTSMKLFTCVLARNSSSNDTFIHYALVILPIQKQNFGEELLRKRNYTEFIFHSYEINSRSSTHHYNQFIQFSASEGTYVKIIPMGNIDIHQKMDLNIRLHSEYPIILEFDIYPIDIYRQKTDENFIGTLNIYEINLSNSILSSTSSTFTTNHLSSSRTSSNSKDFEIFENIPLNSSARTSFSLPESNNERISTRDFNENNLLAIIPIHLSKTNFNQQSIQSHSISFPIPQFFKNLIESLMENKQEFADALNIHPALNISQNSINEMFYKWFKRQNAFQINEIIKKIISALIQIGRVDLAYEIRINHPPSFSFS